MEEEAKSSNDSTEQQATASRLDLRAATRRQSMRKKKTAACTILEKMAAKARRTTTTSRKKSPAPAPLPRGNNKTKTVPPFAGLSAEEVEFMQRQNSMRNAAAAATAAAATEEFLRGGRTGIRTAGTMLDDSTALLLAGTAAEARSGGSAGFALPTTAAARLKQHMDEIASYASQPRLPPIEVEPTLSSSLATIGGDALSRSGRHHQSQLAQELKTARSALAAESCEVTAHKNAGHKVATSTTTREVNDNDSRKLNHAEASDESGTTAVVDAENFKRLKSELQCTKELLEYFRTQAWEANKRAMIQQQQVQQTGGIDQATEFSYKKQLVQQRVLMEDLRDRVARERCLNEELCNQLKALRKVKTVTPATEPAAEMEAEVEEEAAIAEKLAQAKEESFQVENKRLRERIQQLEETIRLQEREHKAALESARSSSGSSYPSTAETQSNAAALAEAGLAALSRGPHSMALGIPSFASRKRRAAEIVQSAAPYSSNEREDQSLVSVLQKRLIGMHQKLEQVATERDALLRTQQEQHQNLILLDDALEKQITKNQRLAIDMQNSKQELQDSTTKRSALVKRFEEAYVTNDTLESRVRELETSNVMLRRRLAKVLGISGHGVDANRNGAIL